MTIEHDEYAPRRRPRWLAYLLVAAGVGAVAWAGSYFAGAGAKKNARSGRPAAAVATATVEASDMPVLVKAIGTVTPLDSSVIHAQLSGNIFAILFTEGQIVQQGQVIAQVDPRPYRLALASAKATLAKDQATLGAALLDLKRYETLASQDSVARQTLDTQRATVGQAQATVAADKAAIGTAELNLQYTSVKAPFTGRIGLKAVSVGTYVTAADTNGIATITRTDPIDVQFTVAQAQLADINKAVSNSHGLPVTALDQDGVTELAKGSFSTFDNQIDTTSGTVKAKARFANPGPNGGKLFPNQFVNVAMLVTTLKQVPTVPISALRHGAPGDFVFVVVPDDSKPDASKAEETKAADGKAGEQRGPQSKVKLVVVKTGPSDGTRVAILQGLNKGQQVVSEGADGLDDGSKVRIGGGGHGGHGGQGGGQGGAQGGDASGGDQSGGQSGGHKGHHRNGQNGGNQGGA
ncbi:efflux RND transporter periplasmic adaptor subunit [Novosphingobium terrae]|uniref:efflux RND transporter periplasmic adaptor subunit n=1 Tax=Novosphingobium terrae TaxID=2726189 RepID=UPI001F12F55B|nr:efflux RND transporter periplasmic adaptor subunit [Novosphingobium terrae]